MFSVRVSSLCASAFAALLCLTGASVSPRMANGDTLADLNRLNVPPPAKQAGKKKSRVSTPQKHPASTRTRVASGSRKRNSGAAARRQELARQAAARRERQQSALASMREANNLAMQAYDHLRRNEITDAASYVVKAINKNRKSSFAHGVAALVFVEIYDIFKGQKYLEVSSRLASDALSLNPNSSTGNCAKAYIAYVRGDYDEALNYINKSISAVSGDPYFYIMRGNIDNLRGHKDAALSDYREALRLDSNIAWAHTSMALTYLQDDDTVHADEELKLANERYATDAWAVAGYYALGKKNWERSTLCFRNAIKVAPENCLNVARYHADLALSLLAQDDRDEALKEAQIAQKNGVARHEVFGLLDIQQ